MPPHDTVKDLSQAYELYAKPIFRHCSFRLFNKADAEEVVQETFVRAWQYVQKGNTIDNLKLFLYRVANNLIVDRVRRRKEDLSLETLVENGFEPGEQDKTDLIQKKLEFQHVLVKFQELDKQEHDLLIMRYIDGLMPADIAQRTGLSANTISVRLHRSIKQISASVRR